MLNKAFEGWETVNETENFKLVLNPNFNPLEPTDTVFSYYVVYKRYNTVESAANSIVLSNVFLQNAEDQFSGEREVKETSARLN